MKNVIIIGSNSEIAKSLIQILVKGREFNLFTISSSDKNLKSSHVHLKINNYFNECFKIIDFIKSIENPTIIFFNGYLQENRPHQYPQNHEILNTIKINFQIPYFLTFLIHKSVNYEKIILISSVAAIKPRYKNYIYGTAKYLIEESLKSLGLNNYLIIRFGMVKTTMSLKHKKAPFLLSSRSAANVIFKNLENSGVVYPSYGVSFFAIIIKLLPIKLLNYIESKY